jgi:flagellar operon protein (TIGR03826 family)
MSHFKFCQNHGILVGIINHERKSTMATQYDVQNCPNCGNIFRKTTWPICQDCKNEMENELSKCTDFIRRNRQTTMSQLIEQTGVSETNITKYIRDSKINISDVPNLSYPCDLCETNIRKGNLCLDCRKRINSDIDKMKVQEVRDKEKLVKENQASFKIQDRLKKDKL